MHGDVPLVVGLDAVQSRTGGLEYNIARIMCTEHTGVILRLCGDAAQQEGNYDK